MKQYCKLFFYTLSFLLLCQQSKAQNRTAENVVSVATELKSYFSIADLPVYREASYVGQVSSYDRTGGNDDGFSGRFSYMRKLQDNSLVLFEMQGPGIINRIWTPTPSNDSLDFYIDDT